MEDVFASLLSRTFYGMHVWKMFYKRVKYK